MLTAESLELLRQFDLEEKRLAISAPLLEFIPFAAELQGLKYDPPSHLRPLIDALGRAFRGDRLRFGFSVPPQHGKTRSLEFAIAQAILREPRLQVGFGSYRAQYAYKRSTEIRDIVQSFGHPLHGSFQGGAEWRTVEGGGVIAGGIDRGFTGNTLGVCIVDDPYDGREDADSPSSRESVEKFIVETLQPRTRALIVVQTRWRPDDALGIRSKDPDWQVVNLPALAEPTPEIPDPLGRSWGESLWPKHFPAGCPAFVEAQKDAFAWSALYQGRPRPRGGKVFERDPSYFEQLPSVGVRIAAVGYDLAASSKKTADYQGAVCMVIVGDEYYVTSLERKQCATPEFLGIIERVAREYPSATRFAWIGGSELGVVQLLNQRGARLTSQPANAQTGDKFARAQPFAADWNAGKVHLLSRAPWTRELVDELSSFTGVGDKHDDMVDMLAAAHHILRPYARKTGVPGNIGPSTFKGAQFGGMKF